MQILVEAYSKVRTGLTVWYPLRRSYCCHSYGGGPAFLLLPFVRRWAGIDGDGETGVAHRREDQ